MPTINTFSLTHSGFYINLPCGGVVMGLFFLIEIPSRGMQMVGESFWNKIKKLDLIGFLIFAPFAARKQIYL